MGRLLSASAILGLVCALAQPAAAQDLQAKLQKKLAGPWLKNASWVTDYDKALAQATEKKGLVFGYFTRSYSP